MKYEGTGSFSIRTKKCALVKLKSILFTPNLPYKFITDGTHGLSEKYTAFLSIHITFI